MEVKLHMLIITLNQYGQSNYKKPLPRGQVGQNVKKKEFHFFRERRHA
jgi:hypothetical protein